MTKIIYILSVLGILGIAYAGLSAPIPSNLQLKTTQERILENKEMDDMRCDENFINCVKVGRKVKYSYASEIEVKEKALGDVLSDSDLVKHGISLNQKTVKESQRLYNGHIFDLGEKKIGVFYAGTVFAKEKLTGKWYLIKWATTTPEAWKKQTTAYIPQAFAADFYPDPDPETATVDGFVRYYLGDCLNWANLRLADGNEAADDGPGVNAVLWQNTGCESPQFSVLGRSIFLFNTGPTIPAGSTIDSATLSIWGISKQDDGGNLPTINVFSSNPASNTALAAGDFDTIGTTQFATSITYANWIVDDSAYNIFTLNTAGKNAIATGSGVTKFALREATYDAGGATPAWAATTKFNAHTVEVDDTAICGSATCSDPKLTVSWTAPGGGAAGYQDSDIISDF